MCWDGSVMHAEPSLENRVRTSKWLLCWSAHHLYIWTQNVAKPNKFLFRCQRHLCFHLAAFSQVRHLYVCSISQFVIPNTDHISTGHYTKLLGFFCFWRHHTAGAVLIQRSWGLWRQSRCWELASGETKIKQWMMWHDAVLVLKIY